MDIKKILIITAPQLFELDTLRQEVSSCFYLIPAESKVSFISSYITKL